jgi:hypothetical protein
MSTPEQITAMVARYRELNTRAPEEIRDQWQATTELIAKAATSDLSTPTQQADLVKLAYATDKSVKAVVKYAKETCDVDFSPSATVAVPPTTVVGS